MKNQVTQLSFDFEFNQVSTVEKEIKCEVKKTVTARYSITKAEFEAQLKEEERLNKLILENLGRIQLDKKEV